MSDIRIAESAPATLSRRQGAFTRRDDMNIIYESFEKIPKPTTLLIQPEQSNEETKPKKKTMKDIFHLKKPKNKK
jgi:hypothetical protein